MEYELKVVSNKNGGGLGKRQMFGNGFGPWRSRVIIWTKAIEGCIPFEHIVFLKKHIIMLQENIKGSCKREKWGVEKEANVR